MVDFSEINKSVGLNKAVLEGFFSHICRWQLGVEGKISEIDKCLGPNKGI